MPLPGLSAGRVPAFAAGMVLAPAFGACVLRREQPERRSRDGNAAAATVGVSLGPRLLSSGCVGFNAHRPAGWLKVMGVEVQSTPRTPNGRGLLDK